MKRYRTTTPTFLYSPTASSPVSAASLATTPISKATKVHAPPPKSISTSTNRGLQPLQLRPPPNPDAFASPAFRRESVQFWACPTPAFAGGPPFSPDRQANLIL